MVWPPSTHQDVQDEIALKIATTAADAAYPSKAATVNLIDAAGDLLVGSADNTLARLAKGTALQTLRVNAGATALEWAASSAGIAAAGALSWGTSSVDTGGGIVQLYRVVPGATLGTKLFPVVMPRAGSIVGAWIRVESARTGGTLYAKVYKNGTFLANVCTHDGGADTRTTTDASKSIATGTQTFAAGDRLDMRQECQAVYTPSGGYAEMGIVVAFD